MPLMNKSQQRALLRLWESSCKPAARSYLAFRRSAQYSGLLGCWMVYWCSMWVGIESDGYTHS